LTGYEVCIHKHIMHDQTEIDPKKPEKHYKIIHKKTHKKTNTLHVSHFFVKQCLIQRNELLLYVQGWRGTVS